MQHTGISSRWSLCKHGRCQSASDNIMFRSHFGSKPLCAPRVALVRISFLLLSALAMGGGIKQRLQVGEATEAQPAAGTTVRGGLRKRLCSALSSSTAPSAKTVPYCAKRQKPKAVSNLPLNRSLKRDWARGNLPSDKVLEHAAGASSQGARGLESFAGGCRNAHRKVVAALGYPEKAPKFSWIDIPVAGGGVQPQPILCQILRGWSPSTGIIIALTLLPVAAAAADEADGGTVLAFYLATAFAVFGISQAGMHVATFVGRISRGGRTTRTVGTQMDMEPPPPAPPPERNPTTPRRFFVTQRSDCYHSRENCKGLATRTTELIELGSRPLTLRPCTKCHVADVPA